MTVDEARAVAKEAAEVAVRHTLISLGMDPDDFTETQKDHAFLRSWRLSTEAMKRQGLVTAVGVFVIGLLGLIWMTLKGTSGGP